MKGQSRTRPKRGDIVEIVTPKGLVYLQYTHRHLTYGTLVRILPGIFQSRPEEFSTLAKEQERFVVFFPLATAVRQGIVEIVSNEEVPDRNEPFPLFRSRGAVQPGTNRVLWWSLWDGERYRRLDSLTEEQRNLPVLGIWNDTLLAERIAKGWSPRDDS